MNLKLERFFSLTFFLTKHLFSHKKMVKHKIFNWIFASSQIVVVFQL